MLAIRCCDQSTTSGNQGFPKFTRHLYATAADRSGLAVTLYAPSELSTVLPDDGGGGNRVHIVCDTEYPFDEQVRFTVTADKPFNLDLRIPGWADAATVTTDGGAAAAAKNGTFFRVAVAAGDSTVVVTLPMAVRLVHGTAP